MSDVVLFDYPKSSASYRVRIALNLAGIDYHSYHVDLLKGAQAGEEHLARNPQGLVPVLDIDGVRLTQSLAILDYLNETRQIGLLATDPTKKAQQRALAMAIAVDLHPICNLRVVNHATKGEEPARTAWMQHFIGKGLAQFEKMLAPFALADYCTGDAISMADICLIPQLYNARRWGADCSTFDRINQVVERLEKLPAFANAHPDQVAPSS